jgi:peptidoglycan/LPS O-acetylase OafA/YrhL
MTIAVVISHYFAELPHGIRALGFGWIAVNSFFVLSGYLIANLILDKIDRENFFSVFYVRRFCRTLPCYFLCVVTLYALLSEIAGRDWADLGTFFPLWSYLTMSQNFFMMATQGIGPHWLAPSWTLAIEEQFYLIVPSLFFLVPRRHLFAVLTSCAIAAVVIRSCIYLSGPGDHFGALVFLPSRADVLICGMLFPVAARTFAIDWSRWDRAIRIVPLFAILIVFALRLIDRTEGTSFFWIFNPLFVAVAAAFYIFALTRGAPEARTCHARILRFFGSISYSTYLTHLAVLGLMHGVLLGQKPDLTSPRQLLVTLAALPVATFVGWALTKLVEEPITAYGRSWKWSEKRSARALRLATADAAPPYAAAHAETAFETADASITGLRAEP